MEIKAQEFDVKFEASYLIFAVPEHNQAESLASYMERHGIEAVCDGSNEVTCPVGDDKQCRLIFELRKLWWLWWENCDAELYGLPFYTDVDVN